jgi:hypothetical protein
VTVLVEEVEAVVVGEVLKLEESMRPLGLYGHAELLNELIVSGVIEALLLRAKVVVIRVVGGGISAEVKANRQSSARMEARRSNVEGELTNRDAHATSTEVTETKDARAISDDDDGNVASPVVEDLADMALISTIQEKTFRETEMLAELLTSLADGRGINEGAELLKVVGEEVVEERLVSMLHELEVIELLYLRLLSRELQHAPGSLLLDSFDSGREEAAEFELLALLSGKGGAFVEGAVVKDR